MFEIITIGGALLILYWAIFTKDTWKYALIAAAVSLAWVLSSGLYGYREANYVFYGINLFAFFAWTAGLVISKKLYEWKFKDKYWLFVISYMILIFTVEFLGYNYWGIKLTTHYPGIFGIEAMHMPWWGQLYYLTAGPLFVLLTGKNVLKKRK